MSAQIRQVSGWLSVVLEPQAVLNVVDQSTALKRLVSTAHKLADKPGRRCTPELAQFDKMVEAGKSGIALREAYVDYIVARNRAKAAATAAKRADVDEWAEAA